MSWLVTAKQYIPAVIGEPFGGGYFAGYISHTANGNPTHALIVAPRATGATGTGYTLTTNLTWAANANAPDGVNYSTTLTGGSFTGSITGTTMTVTEMASGKIRPGHTITGTGVAVGTTVVSQINGTTNGAGDYTVSILQTFGSRALNAVMSEFDGVANGTVFKDIDNTVGSGSTIFPAANFCEALSIGGFADWYLPSRYELEIAYFNLKPSAQQNFVFQGISTNNVYAVPFRSFSYTLTKPAQTTLPDFNTTSEGFVATEHNSSSEVNSTNIRNLSFANGSYSFWVGNVIALKTTGYSSRAFRRIAL